MEGAAFHCQELVAVVGYSVEDYCGEADLDL
jgi:hypothetical protein